MSPNGLCFSYKARWNCYVLNDGLPIGLPLSAPSSTQETHFFQTV